MSSKLEKRGVVCQLYYNYRCLRIPRWFEFDKAGRGSSSDYTVFNNKEQWPKWQHQLIGTAYKHKTELVLNSTYVRDPNDPEAVDLFQSMQGQIQEVENENDVLVQEELEQEVMLLVE